MADNRNKMIYGKDIVGKKIQDKSAVALEYTLHDKAPKVIASGKGYLAEKIIDLSLIHICTGRTFKYRPYHSNRKDSRRKYQGM